MAEYNFGVNIKIECPFCQNNAQNQFDAVYGTEYLLTGDGLEVQTVDGDYHDELKEMYDSLLAAKCGKCGKLFSIDVDSSTGDIRTLREIEHIFTKVEFSSTGAPKTLIVGSTSFHIQAIDSYKHLYNKGADILFGRLPFGEWIVRLKDGGRCKVSVLPETGDDLMSIDGDRITASINRADGFSAPHLKKVNEYHSSPKSDTEEDLDEWLDTMHNQPLPHRFLTEAAFTVIVETEASIRQILWRYLEQKYSQGNGRWWKGSLVGQMADQIQRRASTAGDSNFRAFSPAEFLTVGELRDLIERKWDAVYKDHFGSKDRILAAFIRFEDSRNPVAHGRAINYEHYCRALDAAKELRHLLNLME